MFLILSDFLTGGGCVWLSGSGPAYWASQMLYGHTFRAAQPAFPPGMMPPSFSTWEKGIALLPPVMSLSKQLGGFSLAHGQIPRPLRPPRSTTFP